VEGGSISAGKCLILTMVIMLLSAGVVSGTSTSPSSLSKTVLRGENTSQTFTIICDNENVSDSQVIIVGDTAENETVLKDIITVYPSYFDRLDNSENKTFTAYINIPSDADTGTFSGYFRVTGLINIPISITVEENENIVTGGLVPTKGTIVATMGTTNELTKTFKVYNYTGYDLTDFDAEMTDVQLYGEDSIDWFIVSFEAPYSFTNGSSVDVQVDISPASVPAGTYERTLRVSAMHNATKYTADVKFRITVYGETLSENEVTIRVTPSPTEVGTGETIVVNVTPTTASVDVYLGSQKLGTVSDGSLTMEAPMTTGVYTLSFKNGGSVLSTKSMTVFTKKQLTISLDSDKVQKGSKITGTVLADGNPISGILVSLGNKATYTNQNGSFEIDADSSGTIVASSEKDTSNYVWYLEASQSVSVYEPTPWTTYVGIVILTAFVGFLAYMRKEEVIGFIRARLGGRIGL